MKKPVLFKVRFPTLEKLPFVTGILIGDEWICGGTEYIDEKKSLAFRIVFATPNIFLRPQEKFRSLNEVVDPNSEAIHIKDFSKVSNKKSKAYRSFTEFVHPMFYRSQIKDTQKYASFTDFIDSEFNTIRYNVSFQLEKTVSQIYPNSENKNKAICGLRYINFNATKEGTSASYIQEICGISKIKNIKKRPDQGIERGSSPWTVLVMTDSYCDGVLISSKTVITAAHCINLGHTNCIPRIGVGFNEIFNYTDIETYIIDKIFIHPDYKPDLSTLDGDISVIITERRIEFTNFVIPACLGNADDEVQEIEGRVGIVIGWAMARPYGNHLRNLSAIIKTNKNCITADSRVSTILSNRTFCAKNTNKFGPCGGHSGSGLLIYRNNRWTLRGILSGTLDRPSFSNVAPDNEICKTLPNIVYGDVSKFHSWILSHAVY